MLLESCDRLRPGGPPTRWHDWQKYWPGRNAFSRDYIFTLARYQRSDLWLFGGVFAVVARQPGQGYVVKLTDEGADMIGCLTVALCLPPACGPGQLREALSALGGAGDSPRALRLTMSFWRHCVQSKPFQPVVFGRLIELQAVLHRCPLIRLPRPHPERVRQA